MTKKPDAVTAKSPRADVLSRADSTGMVKLDARENTNRRRMRARAALQSSWRAALNRIDAAAMNSGPARRRSVPAAWRS